MGALSNSDRANLMATIGDPHLDESVLAGFLDGDLEPETRDRAIAHLDACTDCRAELRSVSELATSLPVQPHVRSRRTTLWTAMAGLLAASVAAVAVIRQPGRIDQQETSGRSRAMTEGTARIDVVSPGPAAPPSRAAVFVWRSAAVDVYRFTLLSKDGAVLFSGETPDTTFAWPREVNAVPGTSYFWRVDGVAGTITASTGARRIGLER